MWASTLAVPTFFTIFLLGALFGFFQQIENYGLNYINQGLDIYVILPLIAIVLAILGFFGLVRGLLYKHDLKTMILLILGLIAYMPLLMARSEEHTSELQSLMRISYAVFCLKKKQLIITS